MMSNLFDNTNKRGVTRRGLLKAAVGGAAALTLAPAKAMTGHAGQTLPLWPKDIVAPKVTSQASAFDLADVRLLPGPFQHAQDQDGAYLLFLEPDRLLHNFRVNAGLPPKGAIYGGWEALGVAGHITGHYLSACSMMYRATGESRFRQRVDYMVSELALCQQQAPDGLVTAIPDARTVFGKIATDGTVTGWVPWYTMHKLYAGLRDSYRACGNTQARDVLVRLSDWADHLTQNLTDAQFQKMLDTEHGGMAESLADVYAITGEPKYLALAHRFTHHAVFDPLAAHKDQLDGLHSNTQIPKMIGYARIYELTGEKPYHEAPQFFWQTVVETRTYPNGGNGDYEHFFPVSQFRTHVDSDLTTETCCSYNMLKLTVSEFEKDSQAHYAEYYEQALINDILASQDPHGGMMTYFMPAKAGHFKVYNDPVNAFWCCVGTGIENHATYGAAIYFHGTDQKTLYVNQFLPSTLNWRQKSITLRQETKFPAGDTTRLALTCARPTKFALKIRRPTWAPGMTVAVNGKHVPMTIGSDGYISLSRTWHSGDVVEVGLPMSLRMQPLPNAPEVQAVMYGPMLLADAMGRAGMDSLPDIQPSQSPYNNLPALTGAVFVSEAGDLNTHIHPVPGQDLTFRTEGLGQPADVTLIPLYQMHHHRYNTYHTVYTPEGWEQQKAQVAAELAVQNALDARTVDQFLPGDQQSEADHHLADKNSNTGNFSGRSWRDANDGWFSFTMKTDPAASLALLCTYWGSDANNRSFEILVDGTQVGSQTLENNKPNAFFDVAYPIPATLTAGKTSITVKLQALPKMQAGGLFGCRIVRQAS
jgi:DUF1680 family protein